jgi:uncharacterized protein (DUF2147 family)
VRTRIIVAASIVLSAMSGAVALAEPTAAGIWEQTSPDDGNPEAWVLIEEKNGVFDGRYVKLFPEGGKKQASTCDTCPGFRKGARILGLNFIYGLKRDGLNYSDGHIIDVRNGSIYNFKGWLSKDGVEFSWCGYLWIFYSGRMPLWRRLPQGAIRQQDIPRQVLRARP